MNPRNLSNRNPTETSVVGRCHCGPALSTLTDGIMLRGPRQFVSWLSVAGLAIGGAGIAPWLTGSGEPAAATGQPRPAAAAPQSAGEFRHDEFTGQVLPFLQQYCLECHTGDDTESGLDLSRFDSQASVGNELETWQSVLEALDTDYMPPREASQPAAEEIESIKNWFSRTLAGHGNLERPQEIIRRLNRSEYENTVRDLLQLKSDVFDNPNRIVITDDYFQPASGRMPRYVLAMSHHSYIQRKPAELPGISELPVDPPVLHGFNNDQSTLSFSPVHMEACLALANSILNDANFSRQSQLWDSLFVVDDIARDRDALLALADQRLSVFLPRAFRRPVSNHQRQRYLDLFARELENGDFTRAMKTTVSAVLASPRFLLRMDRMSGQPGQAAAIDAWDMASRLSYFLWASMPDDELFRAAAEGRLQSNADLEYQVQRMLKDRKSKSLSTEFGMQWLKLAKVNSARPDNDLFPGWYRKDSDSPGVSMMIEQLLLFETIMVEDRSILEFISADFAYLNRQLMDWYYVDPSTALGYTPDPESFEDFFRIQWPNTHRGGILTSGAMLVSTSATTRTSPVYRGAWILDVVFNRPPPPPPPDVPALDSEDIHAGVPNNVREKLSAHRQNPACAVCHDRIDPIGFALENFDPVARFRKTYRDGVAIDARGELYGDPYEGAARFKNVILRQKQRFVRGFVEHVVRYALGRQLHVSDEPELARIATAVAEQEYRFGAVIREVALSDLFRSQPAAGIDDRSAASQTGVAADPDPLKN